MNFSKEPREQNHRFYLCFSMNSTSTLGQKAAIRQRALAAFGKRQREVLINSWQYNPG